MLRPCHRSVAGWSGSTGPPDGKRAWPSHTLPPHGHGAFGAVGSSSLTSHFAPATPASRTARFPQFSAVAYCAIRKSAPPLAASGGRVPRSLTPRGYRAASFRQKTKGDFL
jgi:hypothetical protein